MLEHAEHKVVYGTRKAGVSRQVFMGKTWTLASSTSQEDGLHDLHVGINEGKLPKWQVMLKILRQGLNIADRPRILAENGVVGDVKGKSALEQAIMIQATLHDTESWVETCQRGPVAIIAYCDAMVTGMTDLLPKGETLTVQDVPELLKRIIDEA